MVTATHKLRRLAAAILFAVGTAMIGIATTEAISDQLNSNDELLPGESRSSSNGKYRLVYQWDGNLVLYDDNDVVMWASNTAATSPGRAAMQSDGNFVVYDSNWTSVWASGTVGNSGAYLLVQNDGNVVIYSSSSSALWSTDTATGRWIWNSGDMSCTWDPSETGDNECGPDFVPDVPEISGEEDPAFEEADEDPQGFSGASETDDYPQEFDAQTGLPSCNSYTKSGNVGYIAVQTVPGTGYLNWGAYMYQVGLNFGWWKAQVLVNGHQVDFKSQYYPPHASLPPSVVPIGSVVTINVVHYYWTWILEWVWQGWGGREGGWWGGWRPVFRLGPQVATGSLTCIKRL